jgi:HSP20 family protein
MSSIEVRKNGETGAAMTPSRERFAPFRMMRELMNWDPFREIMPVLPEPLTAEFAPAFDIKETKDAYIFKADVPGVKESDLEVMVSGNRLTVSGKREDTKEEKGDRYYAYERSYGSFTRAFTLPEGVDTGSCQADLKDGVLTLTVQKTAQAQAKKIPVQTAAKK